MNSPTAHHRAVPYGRRIDREGRSGHPGQVLELDGARGNVETSSDFRSAVLRGAGVSGGGVDADRREASRALASGSTTRAQQVAPIRALEGSERTSTRVVSTNRRSGARRARPGHVLPALRDHDPQLVRGSPPSRRRAVTSPGVLVQRQGRALRSVRGRRSRQDRDALSPRRLRSVRRLQRKALQPRDTGSAIPRQEHRRRARHDGRRGRRVLPAVPARSATSW